MQPDKVITAYLDYREANAAHQTVRSYQYRFAKFEDW